jgi:tetratricopeptide (TPR) repeat protein
VIPSIEQEIRDLHALLGSAQDPEGRAFVPLADAYRRAGDPDRALDLLGRGLERHPDLAAGYLMQALAFRDLADDAGAEAAFRQVLSLDGDNARALVGLGRLMRGEGQDEEAERLVRRGVALDPRLASEGTPDRVPRHSTNPEVVGAESLAPLEWEVLDPPTEEPAPPPTAEPVIEAVMSDVVEAEPEPEPEPEAEAEAEVDDAAPDPATEPVIEPAVADSTAALLALAALAPEAELDGSEDTAGEAPAPEALDIEWEVEEFYRPIPGASADDSAAPEAGADVAPPPSADPTEVPEVEVDELIEALPASGPEVVDDVDEVVVDAWSLAPDGWSAEADADVAPTALAEPTDAGPGIPMDLADLAPEFTDEPLAAMDDPGASSDEAVGDTVLPTRTLGELYARQGLTTEAIEVFRSLAEAEPTNLEHRARLMELEAGLAAGGRARVSPATPGAGPDSRPSDDPPISSFFHALLRWEPGDPAERES